MPRIAVIGAGYVGLVTAACFAELGNTVTCIEVDKQKVQALQQRKLPIQETGLQELFERHMGSQRLRVTQRYEEGLKDCDAIFVCVGSPSIPDGRVNVTQVLQAARSIKGSCLARPLVVIKSTVPPGTAEIVSSIVNGGRSAHERISVVSNPEFLREGDAVRDFLHPDRIIIGAQEQAAGEQVGSLYREVPAPIFYCDNTTAEMIKYASNAFLATKISFINEIALICEAVGIDVQQVAKGIGMDPRIGPAFLGAGLGWGGSCLPKDIRGLRALARHLGTPTSLLSAVDHVNARQPRNVVHRLREVLGSLQGRSIAVWGLTFKAGTDDLRESPALHLVRRLQAEGCSICAYDPVVSRQETKPIAGIAYAQDAYEAVEGVDAVVLATSWSEFLSLDLARVRRAMREPVLFDARNAFDPEALRAFGFTYLGVGRRTMGQRRNGRNGARSAAAHLPEGVMGPFLPLAEAPASR